MMERTPSSHLYGTLSREGNIEVRRLHKGLAWYLAVVESEPCLGEGVRVAQVHWGAGGGSGGRLEGGGFKAWRLRATTHPGPQPVCFGSSSGYEDTCGEMELGSNKPQMPP